MLLLQMITVFNVPTVGGGTKTFGALSTYGNNYFATPPDSGNNNNSGTFDSASNEP